MNELTAKGIANGLIFFDADQRNITCKVQNKRLRFNDAEEKVRANAYLSLVLEYGYAPEQIDIEVAVEHRVPNIYSDIVVYADKSLKKPLSTAWLKLNACAPKPTPSSKSPSAASRPCCWEMRHDHR